MLAMGLTVGFKQAGGLPTASQAMAAHSLAYHGDAGALLHLHGLQGPRGGPGSCHAWPARAPGDLSGALGDPLHAYQKP